MLSPNTILQNRYRVVHELGHGGMGTVYEAVDQRVNCIVALKETVAGNDREAKRAFEREASLLANLRHSTLPKVMDYFTEDEGDFLVMEFIPGYDLAELLDSRESPFPQSQVLRWAFELLRVLEYLHKQEPPILHRDIKPSNLKLTKNGEVFLLDFGLAKGALGQMPTLAASRSVRGYTPIYASLEQIHGHGTDPRSDLYSLGATLYHLLSGVPPVDAPTRFHVLEDGEPDPLPLIQRINGLASPNVAAVIHQAMALSRRDRPISATEMSKALRNAAEEDERNAAEEEYRRADERHRLRDEEKRRAETVAVTGAGEEQQLREAEAKKKQGEGRRKEEERRVQDERNQRAEEERLRIEAEKRIAAKEVDQRHREQILKTRPASTVKAQEVSSGKEPSPPAMKTIAAPPPEKVAAIPAVATNRSFDSYTEPPAKKSYTGIVVASVIVVGLVVGVAVWMMSGSSTKETPADSTSSAGSSPATTKSSTTTPAAPAGMVYVPGGTFMMGRDNGVDEAERPEHQVTVTPFFIDIYETNNSGRPLTGMTWDQADRNCRNGGKRLPTEEEWEFAARGTDGRIYPWGNNWQANAANASGESSGTTNVGSYKNGASPFGAYDMIGNAWEWTASNFKAYPGGRLPASVRSGGDLKVIRGGSYESTKAYATTTYRTGWPARGAKTYDQTGFRCVKDLTK